MYIVVIAWLFVVLMMAITEKSVTAGVMTMLLYGLAPCALLLWLIGTPHRWRTRRARMRDTQAESVRQEQVKHLD
jgi:hypothetical protein